jgi:hypothetical protein
MATKNQIRSVAKIYSYYRNEPDLKSELHGMTQTLQILGLLNEVQKEAFIYEHRKSKESVEAIEKYVSKAYDNSKKFNINCLINGMYEDDIPFMERLTEEEKKCFKANLNYVNEFCK